MEFVIRREEPRDFRAVEELTREAFWNLQVPGCDEHYLAHILRDHRDFVPELDFVAESGGRVVGNIMYTRSWLEDPESRRTETLTFGPVSVLPELQRQGIGGALIRHTAELARQQGVPGIIILGAPHNYCCHGFRSCRDFGITDAEGRYPYGQLVLELTPGALAGPVRKFLYSPVYQFDSAAAEAFDRGFPPKQKEWRYTQEEFLLAVRAVLP